MRRKDDGILRLRFAPLRMTGFFLGAPEELRDPSAPLRFAQDDRGFLGLAQDDRHIFWEVLLGKWIWNSWF